MWACATSDSTRTGWREAEPRGGRGRGAQLLTGLAPAVPVAAVAGGVLADREAAGGGTRVGEASREREWCMLASPFAEARRETGGVEAAEEGTEPPSEVGGEVVGVVLLLLLLEAWHRESGERSPCCCSSKPQHEDREPKEEALVDSGTASSHGPPGWGSYGTGSSPQPKASCWVKAVGLAELLRVNASLTPAHTLRALLGLQSWGAIRG